MLGHLLLCLFLLQSIEAEGVLPAPLPPRKWMTLTGGQPEVVAQGGYSGFFPDSSKPAYDFAVDSSIVGTILYCNVHFSKDNDGFCISQINLKNTTTIDEFDPKGSKTYNIYGQQVHGYFGIDYPAQFIFENVTLKQNIFTRPDVFDGYSPIIGPFSMTEDKNGNPTRLWLNIENDMFYNEHKISPESYILEQMDVLPEFISSPEIGFLKSIGPKLGRGKTKLFFKFLKGNEVEPTTKATYASLAKDLATVKSFASGIVVPKEYIWPMSPTRILQPATTLVQDAHKLGLSVYASGFANDNLFSFNFSYDPVREYLKFIDNDQFSVDGVLSDFPSTASEAIGCISSDKNATREITTLIISHNGASGDFPGATDLAYEKAIEDGADLIDCSVQMSKDGIAFCSDRPDLMKTTTANIVYINRSTNVPQIQSSDGIFSFDLTWSEIQSLSPQIESFFENGEVRNTANKNSGKLLTLPEFLDLCKTKAAPGVLIFIKYAAFLASKGLDLVGTVSAALTNASLEKQKVVIQSEHTSVLLKFKEDFPSYGRVLYLYEAISGMPEQAAQEVKKYADAMLVYKDAITMTSNHFVSNFTKTIPALHAANVSVYVGPLKNEYDNLILDTLSDPYVELNMFFLQHVDGFVTDFPATANSFVRSTCTKTEQGYQIPPVQPGFLYVGEPAVEPPLLTTANVVDPPLPAIAKNETAAAASAPPPSHKSSSTSLMIVSTQGLFFGALTALLTIFT